MSAADHVVAAAARCARDFADVAEAHGLYPAFVMVSTGFLPDGRRTGLHLTISRPWPVALDAEQRRDVQDEFVRELLTAALERLLLGEPIPPPTQEYMDGERLS